VAHYAGNGSGYARTTDHIHSCWCMRALTRHGCLLAMLWRQVPWSATQQLEAAGVNHLRCASPALLRPLLRRLTAATQRDAAQAGMAAGGPLLPAVGPMADCSPEAALQLLTYCTSDLPDIAAVDGPSPAAEASPRQQQLDPAALLPGLFAAGKLWLQA
jgi:hypothetical protein